MPQLSVTQNAIPAQPGMAFDAEASRRDVVSRVAAVNIPFGVLCELTSTGTAQPVQDATTLSGTVTVTNGSASITFSTAQTLAQGQIVYFSDQPTVPYRMALAVSASTSGTLDRLYSGTGGASKLTSLGFNPALIGISIFDPLGVEQNYVSWAVPTVLSGTVSVTNNSTSITFSTNQTLAQGTPIVFTSQPGVQYFLAQAITATTGAQLTTAYTGTTNGSTTTTLPQAGSTNVGWKQGTAVPFMRAGRIWVAGDASGSAVQSGPINVHHSSTGANPQGVFTFLTAPVMTVGNEIDVAPNCTVWNPGLSYNGQYTDPFGNVFSMYVVEISA
jgi:hypothetical protein